MSIFTPEPPMITRWHLTRDYRVLAILADKSVSPAHHGKLKYTKPYACVDGIVCKACKLEWLKRYVIELERDEP